MDEIALSFIVPVYNAEPYLETCLTSLFNQTRQDIEIICVDDGSTDGSVAELERLQAQSPVPVRITQQKNAGPGVARNAGIDRAEGRYLCFIDADDFVAPELAERALAKAEEFSADIVVWDIWYYNHRTERVQYPEAGVLNFGAFDDDESATPFTWEKNPDRIFTSFQNWPWNKIFRTEFVRENNLRFPPLHRTEDLPFTGAALIRAKSIGCVYDRLTYYRMGRADSAMATKDAYPDDFLRNFRDFRQWLVAEGVWPAVRRSYVNWAVSGALYTLETLRTPEVYTRIYNQYREEGLAELDAWGHEPDYFYNPNFVRDLQAVRDHDALGFALYRLWAHEDYEFDDMALHDDLYERIRELTSSLEAEQAGRAEDAAQAQALLARERERLETERDQFAHSAEYRFGKKVLAPARWVQRKLREREAAAHLAADSACAEAAPVACEPANEEEVL